MPGSAGGPPPCDRHATDGLSLKLIGNVSSSSDGGNTTQSTSLKLRLFESTTNQTMRGVTYYVNITKASTNQTALDGLFLSYPGTLILRMEPGEVGRVNATVFMPAQSGPLYYSDRNGTLTVKDSDLVEKDSKYLAHVQIYGVNSGGPNLCPGASVPTGDFAWTAGDDELITVPEFPSLPLLVLLASIMMSIIGWMRFAQT